MSAATFQDAIRAAGLQPPNVIEPGKIYRFPGIGKRNGNTSGWCRLFDAGLGGVFGDWSADFYETWHEKRRSELSRVDLETFNRRVEESKQQVDADRKLKSNQAAKQSAVIWGKAQPCASHAYCVRKKIGPNLARVLPARDTECKGWFWTTNNEGQLTELDGDLILLPLYNIDDELRGLQAIDEIGRKSLIKGLTKKGLFIPLTDGKISINYTGRIYIGEGFSTIATIRQATGEPSVSAIDASNLLHVARELHQKFPYAEMVIAGDVDKSGIGQKKAHEAASTVSGMLVLPPFTDDELATDCRPSDWNDYASIHGIESIKIAMESVEKNGNRNSHIELRSPAPVDSCQRQDEFEPEPLRANLLPAEPYPVDALGDVLGAAARAIHKSVKAPLALCCQSVLAAASLAAQAHFDIKLPWGERRPLSLFLLTVGESGERKTGVDDLVLGAAKVQERADMEAYTLEQTSYETELAAWTQATDAARKAVTTGKKGSATTMEVRAASERCGNKPVPPIAPLRFVSDPTVEGLYKLLVTGQPSVALFSDEGGLLIGGHALNSDNALKTMARWCKLWDGSPFDRVRAGDGAGVLYGRRMALHQLAQPDVMTTLLSDRMANGQGLLARCLVAWPESTIGTRHIEKYEWAGDQYELKRLFAVFKGLMEAEPRSGKSVQELDPVELPLTDEAKDLARAASNQFETLMARGADLAELRDRTSKAVENACRIAGVLAVIEGGLSVRAIDRGHLERALILVQWYLSEALRIRGAAAIPQSVIDAELLSAWLREREFKQFRSKQVLRFGPNQLRNKMRLTAATNELVTNGYLAENEKGTIVDDVAARKSWRVLHHVV